MQFLERFLLVYLTRAFSTSVAYAMIFSAGCAQNVQWVDLFPGAGDMYDVAVHSDGSIVVSGRVFGTVDCDPGPGVVNISSLGEHDAFACRYASDGSLIWARRFGGPENDDFEAMKMDVSGNIYLSGFNGDDFSTDPVGAEPLFATPGGFVLKLNLDGEVEWRMKYQRGVKEFGIAPDGAVFVLGIYNGEYNFANWPETFYMDSDNNSMDIFITKLNPDGSFLWAKRIGGPEMDNMFDMTIDDDANLYVYGYFNFNCDVDPGPEEEFITSNGAADIMLVKLNSDGELLWANQYGGSDVDYPNKVIIGGDGFIYHTGRFRHEVDFDPGQEEFIMDGGALEDCFIAKTSSNGEFVWAKQLITAAGLIGLPNIAQTSSGDLVLCGSFQGVVDLIPGSPGGDLVSLEQPSGSGAENDIFLYSMGSDGTFRSLAVIASPLSEYTAGMAIDASGLIHMLGFTQGELDFDPGPGSFLVDPVNGYDWFLAKFAQPFTGLPEASSRSEVIISPNPSSGLLTICLPKGLGINGQVEFIDAMGHLELSYRPQSDISTIDLSDFAPGLYLAKFSKGPKSWTERVVISR